MPKKYRQNRDNKVDLKRTVSSNSDDPVLNKAKQISRRDDTFKGPIVGIREIDSAFKHFFEKEIKPKIKEDDKYIPVPVEFASPEQWVSIQKHGYMRDENGKVLTPIITLKRTALESSTDYAKLKVLSNEDTSTTYTRKYTQENKYDQFSELIGQRPVPEMYVVNRPDYVTISYDVMVWCEFTDDVNAIVEQVIYFQGGSMGDRYRFRVKADSYNFETINELGSDRVTKCNISLTVNAYIIPEHIGFNENNVKKRFGIGKVVWDTGLEE